MELEGKVALITGGARIGRTVATTLAARGCNLALTYRTSQKIAEATIAEAARYGVRTIALQVDATDEARVAEVVDEVVGSLGRLDILINMASVYQKTPNPSRQDWSRAMEVNATSAFLFAIKAAPAMKRAGAGRIINVSDWLAASGRPRYKGYLAYYASKGALNALTESLALELAPEILVNAIAPGPIMPPPDLSPEENARVIEATPLRRWGGAEEIAKAVIFLIETDFVTGECIRVDGGRHLY